MERAAENRVAPISPVTLPHGRVYTVAAPTIALRTGPGTQYEAAALAKRGTFLVVLEVDANGIWARAMTAQGLVGFVPLELLRSLAGEETPPKPKTAPPSDKNAAPLPPIPRPKPTVP